MRGAEFQPDLRGCSG